MRKSRPSFPRPRASSSRGSWPSIWRLLGWSWLFRHFFSDFTTNFIARSEHIAIEQEADAAEHFPFFEVPFVGQSITRDSEQAMRQFSFRRLFSSAAS